MSEEEIEKLLAEAGDGQLDEAKAAQLKDLLGRDDELTRRFGLMVTLDRMLALYFSRDEGQKFSQDTVQRIRLQQEVESGELFASAVVERLERRKRKRRVWLGGIAAAAAALVLAFIGWNEKNADEAFPVLATIVGSETGADIAGITRGLVAGNRVVFDEGLLEVEFVTGVTVVLNGPMDFEITGPNSGYLHHGRLVAEIGDERGEGFTIDGASGRLIDLGTKFGVAVEPSGEMEVHVLEGVVDAETASGSKTRLKKNEAMRLTGKSSRLLAKADKGAFVTELPPKADSVQNYVRWSFDEEEGEICHDTGKGLGDGKSAARFQVDVEGGEGPKRIEGPFSGAIHLGGRAYLASRFEGIGKTQSRSVAFWVRVPKDFGANEGFGVVSWGSYRTTGTAWQVAINSLEEEGLPGRLRIGTNPKEVVGHTDLRDGKWHHCAVVLYGDAEGRANAGTHVLLYVDGRLESTARKSVLAVNTDLNRQLNRDDHGAWIGRNLAYRAGMSPGRAGKYFRGGLDELVICDWALSHDDVNALMKLNQFAGNDD